MRPFRKKILRSDQDDKQWTDKAAGKIAGAGIWLQTKFAKTMNRMISKIPQKKIKIALIAFCILSGGFSVYLITHAVLSTDKKQPGIEIKPINRPQHFNKTGSEINEPDKYISDEMYQEIQEYKHYMDSLGQAIRPGLLDSIKVLEQIYHSQQTK